MELLRTRQVGEDMPGFVARLEDILQERKARDKFEEEKQLLKQEGERKKKAEIERQQLAAEEAERKRKEEDVTRMKLEEEQARIQEEFKQKVAEAHYAKLQECLASFRAMNSILLVTMDEVLALEKPLQEVAASINIVLKPEQLVTLALLLHYQAHTTLIQLATGAGKSLMLGVLA